jgi:hypothetical protein
VSRPCCRAARLRRARSSTGAPYADLPWRETTEPDLGDARDLAEAIRRAFPGKMLAHNCSPSFNWQRNMGVAAAERFQREVGTGHFDAVAIAAGGGQWSTTALAHSTEAAQLRDATATAAASGPASPRCRRSNGRAGARRGESAPSARERNGHRGIAVPPGIAPARVAAGDWTGPRPR